MPATEKTSLIRTVLSQLNKEQLIDFLFTVVEHYARSYDDELPLWIRQLIRDRDIETAQREIQDWIDERVEMMYQAGEHEQPNSMVARYQEISVLGEAIKAIRSDNFTQKGLNNLFYELEVFETEPEKTVAQLFDTYLKTGGEPS